MAKKNNPQPVSTPNKEAAGEEIRGIVHLGGKDIRGQLPLGAAIIRVKGVGYRLSRLLATAIDKHLSIPSNTMIGKLSEEQMDKVEEVIKNPSKYGVPVFLLNRRKDSDTGEDKHLVASDLTFAVRNDVEAEKKMFSWRGYRHQYGQKVRGQRTRTTGRKGTTMGVAKNRADRSKAAAKAKPTAGKKK